MARWILKMLGWHIVNELPDDKKYMLIVAPHTSNWDFIYGVLAKWAVGLNVNFLGKASLFKSPLGWWFKALGGIPVYRDQKLNMVEQMVQQFSQRDHMILTMSPEGTRSRLNYWKSGFYHIACGAGVPIVMATINFAEKQIKFGDCFMPQGDVVKDMDKVRAFYAGVQGKKPENQGPIRLKMENPKPKSM
ncbi:lysophospholipid acyltransferase family protein [Marinicella gelatinilytica]|uniref:lysophospholipid acyltransferase family protein n=1 Tax=Marinicella gelatinilytica TaxID=2996017 RepID=UPI002260C376|nr:lysophospholipid acyltransferase family protein [Marinicella gelatinilytica]MCX7545875.1 lysophospholipid acyltransferase family protein [Marinicella gelatinilytica]